MQREIVELTTRNVIRRAIKDAGENRVQVDIHGVRQSLSQQFEERFRRYIAHSSIQDERIRKNLASRGITFKPDQRLLYIDPNDEALVIFKELFDELKNQFLYSRESGLNFYLSVRIRHGWLGNHIRRAFQTSRLVTTSDNLGNYGTNTYWMDQLTKYGTDKCELLSTQFATLSRNIDEIIEFTKSSLVQIKTKTDDEGLLDFEFASDEIHKIHLQIQFSKIDSLELFLNEMFTIFWKKTEEQLAIVRDAMSGDVKSKLLRALEDFETQCIDIIHPNRDAALMSAIVSCRTNLQQDLHHIDGWFHIVEEKEVPDFDATLIIKTATEIIHKLHPAKDIKFNSELKSGFICRGEYFIRLLEALSILLDNSILHGGGSPLIVGVDLSYDERNLCFTITNQLKPDCIREELQREISERNSNSFFTGTSKEGKTGYIRLYDRFPTYCALSMLRKLVLD